MGREFALYAMDPVLILNIPSGPLSLGLFTCNDSVRALSLFSMGRKSSFFFSRSLMSGLAALMSIFRLAVGVQGSICCLSTSLTGVMGLLSGEKSFCFDKSIGSFFIGVFGAILDRSRKIFSYLNGEGEREREHLVRATSGKCDSRESLHYH